MHTSPVCSNAAAWAESWLLLTISAWLCLAYTVKLHRANPTLLNPSVPRLAAPGSAKLLRTQLLLSTYA
jgi:hypothetical protein